VAVGNQVDEDELEDELEQMQQEQLDEQMTKTGTVPVSDTVHKLPAAANGPRKYTNQARLAFQGLMTCIVKGKAVEEDDEEEELRKLQAEMAM
jgi:charged multivesicular body protein 4